MDSAPCWQEADDDDDDDDSNEEIRRVKVKIEISRTAQIGTRQVLRVVPYEARRDDMQRRCRPQLSMGPFERAIAHPHARGVTTRVWTQREFACGIVARSALLSLARVICRTLEKRGGAKTLEAWCVRFRKCDGTGRIGVEEDTYTSSRNEKTDDESR